MLADKKDVAEGVSCLSETLGEALDPAVAESMKEIAAAVNAAKEADFALVFDPTLVRGMSYYTGTISRSRFRSSAEAAEAAAVTMR